ncbi:MAG: DUF2846 domain-containing protein [Halioglobus sp.]
MKTRLLLIFLALVTLRGCANSDYFEPVASADPGSAVVYIYRPKATSPGLAKPLSSSYPEIMMNGESVGFIKYNRYLPVEVQPGEHEFLITGLTPNARWEPKDLKYKLKVEAGQTYYMRLRVEFDTDKMSLGTFTGQYIINFHPVANDEAIYEIRHTDIMD